MACCGVGAGQRDGWNCDLSACLELAQKKDPEYSVDQDKAPETTFSGSDYGGRKSESRTDVAPHGAHAGAQTASADTAESPPQPVPTLCPWETKEPSPPAVHREER